MSVSSPFTLPFHCVLLGPSIGNSITAQLRHKYLPSFRHSIFNIPKIPIPFISRWGVESNVHLASLRRQISMKFLMSETWEGMMGGCPWFAVLLFFFFVVAVYFLLALSVSSFRHYCGRDSALVGRGEMLKRAGNPRWG